MKFNKRFFASDKGKPVKLIETHLTGYYLNLDYPIQREKYQAICQERESQDIPLFDCIVTRNEPAIVGSGENSTVYLETDCIFDNQWNTQDGRRVFEWFEAIYPNRRIKAGHYLQITPAMREIQKNTFKCGYCGKEYYGNHNEGKFCSSCLDSSYLKKQDLHLLKVMPVFQDVGRIQNRPQLTQAEADIIHPIYTRMQTRGNTSRAAQAHKEERKNIITKARIAIAKARTERNGMIWLYKNGVNTENVIYYSHRNVFSFGWRNPLDQDTAADLKELLKEFPFESEIKTL